MGWRSRFSQIYHETGQAASFLDWKDFKSIQDQATTFSAIQIYGLRTNAQPRTLGYLLTLPPLAIIH